MAAPARRPAGSHIRAPWPAPIGPLRAEPRFVLIRSPRWVSVMPSSPASRRRAADNTLAGRPALLESYTASVVEYYTHYRMQQTAYYGLEQRWPDTPFWR